MKLTVLGSGCWEGVPAPFCNCKVCVYATKNSNSKEFRTRPSFLFENEEFAFLIEVSPDIRLQSSRYINTKISDFLISHAHFDHLGGLPELDAYSDLLLEKGMRIYGPQAVGEYISKHYSYIKLKFIPLSQFDVISFENLNIEAVTVKHFSKMTNSQHSSNSLGYVIQSTKSKIVYLADYFALSDDSFEIISGADLVIADGTYLFEESYPSKLYQNKITQEFDSDHLHGKAIFDQLAKLKAKQIVFHSISHLPELMHHEIQTKLPDTMLATYDGMQFEFE